MGQKIVSKEEMQLIHLLKTPRQYYLYSANRNTVINISEELYRFLDGQTDEGLSRNAMREVESLRHEQFLSDNRIRDFRHPALNVLKESLEHRVSQICLQVTQACNLTCAYCPYANYTEDKIQRNHANRYMSFETAKKALDFYLEHSDDRQNSAISFYGGEPLLAFDLIRQVVEYVNERFVGKDILFSMTTNGTMLSDEIIEFFAEHKFALMFSIDGPAKIHDINRKRIDGTGSFSVAFESLKKTIARYEKIGEINRISVNTVMNPQNEIDDVLTLYEDPVFQKGINGQIDPADMLYLENGLEGSETFDQKLSYLYFLGRLDYLQLVREIHMPKSFPDRVLSQEKQYEDLKNGQSSLPDVGSPGGPCIPGVRKLFVTVDGDFFPCEKVNELAEDLKIGNIETGFDLEKAASILNVSAITPEQCRDCWAQMQCGICARECEKDGKISKEIKLKNCREKRIIAESLIYDYILRRECQTVYKGGAQL
ncbi:MAG: radical SAM protein [Clostridia bacterium]|nr:radical SAM protein [Clostridia bacterium]